MTKYQKTIPPKYVEAFTIVEVGAEQKNRLVIVVADNGQRYALNAEDNQSISVGDYLLLQSIYGDQFECSMAKHDFEEKYLKVGE
mgnify:CR=1 FL=1